MPSRAPLPIYLTKLSSCNNLSSKDNNISAVTEFLRHLCKPKMSLPSSESRQTLPYPEPLKNNLNGHAIFIQSPTFHVRLHSPVVYR